MWNVSVFLFQTRTNYLGTWLILCGRTYIYSTQTLCSVSALAIVVVIYIPFIQAGDCEFCTNTPTLSVGSQKPLTTVGVLCPWKGVLSTRIKTGFILPGFCMCFCGEFLAVLHIPSSTLCMSRLSPASADTLLSPPRLHSREKWDLLFSNINTEDMLRGSFSTCVSAVELLR